METLLPGKDFRGILPKPLVECDEITMECKYEPQDVQWEVEYAVQMFPEDMTEKDRKGINMDGYIPVMRDGVVVGRAYLSKFAPKVKQQGNPVAEVKIVPKVNDE